MLRADHNIPFATGVAVAALWLACGPAWGRPGQGPSEKDWQDALAAIRRIALDAGEAEGYRAKAVTACVKLLLRRKRPDEALKFCREVAKAADKAAVIEAALRAGCLVERGRHGHLHAELDFLASWSRPPQGQAASALARELRRAALTLMSLAAKVAVPAPVVPRAPHWATAAPGQTPAALRVAMPRISPPAWYRFQPGRPHAALQVKLPRFTPPSWYGRVAFPPLKEPRSK